MFISVNSVGKSLTFDTKFQKCAFEIENLDTGDSAPTY